MTYRRADSMLYNVLICAKDGMSDPLPIGKTFTNKVAALAFAVAAAPLYPTSRVVRVYSTGCALVGEFSGQETFGHADKDNPQRGTV